MFPLSKQQEVIWLHQQIAPDSRAYYFTAVVDLRGDLDVAALQDAVGGAVRQHEALRLRLRDSEDSIPAQEVVPEVEVQLPVHDLRDTPDPGERRRGLLRQHALQEFDLAVAPLARWLLLRLDEKHWQLVHTEHHLIHDGRSFGSFLADVFGRYGAEVGGSTYQPPEGPSYEEYVTFTRSPDSVADASRAVAWWADALKGATYGVEFPGLGTRSTAGRDFAGAQYRQTLPAELMAVVVSAAKAGGYTPFTALFSAFAEICRRHSGQEEVVIGTALPNRPPRFEHTVGMLVNSVPVRLPAAAGASGHQSARSVLASMFDALDHQCAPIQDVVKSLGLSAAALDNPLFNVMFSMHDRPLPRTELPGLAVEVHGGLNERSARFDLDLVVLPPEVVFGDAARQEYTVVWDYSTQRFSEQDITTLASRFEYLLRRYAKDPDLPISSLEVADPVPAAATSERLQVATSESPAARSFADRPGPAVIQGAETLTYLDLDGRVEERIGQLRQAGLREGDVLALLVARGIDAIVYLLACVRTGIVFAPLSTALPPNLLVTILSRLRPAAVLTTPAAVADLSVTDRLICDVARPDRVLRPGAAGVPRPSAAYVIHTSGTTGVPKAVVVPRDSLNGIVSAVTETYQLSGDDRVLQFTDPAFDMFLEEVLPTIAAGGCLVLPRHEAPTGEELGALVLAREVSVLNIPTSYALAVVDALDTALTGRDHRLRLVIVGGDRLPSAGLRSMGELAGGPRVLNAYGVTEAVITSSAFELGDIEVPEGADVPIGHPLNGVDLCVVTRGVPQPHGMVGELAIAVPGEQTQYVDDPDANGRRYLRLPSRSGRVYFLTGDRGYQDPDGRFYFLGRTDRQVKVNGYRVELEEIELAVKLMRPGTDCAVTIAQSGESRSLVGFLTGTPGDSDGIEQLLSRLLPHYAIPRRWVVVPVIPRHAATGKVDFASLEIPPESPTTDMAEQAAGQEPGYPWLQAFREVLKRNDVAGDADFFRMGGHSLLVFRLLARYEELTGWRPPASLVFQHPTARRLEAESARLREAEDG